jgi:signal-transduction protein with cAMP-binding, CBS, and nucleotidyltransferase domain
MVVGREDEALIGIVGRMRAADATCAVIVDARGRAIGLLDADDILRRAIFDMPPEQPVRGALGARQRFVRVDEPLFLAIARMASDRRERAVAVDAAGQPAGILHRDAALTGAMGGWLGALARAGSVDDVAGLARSKAAQAEVVAAMVAEQQPAVAALEFMNAANSVAVARLTEEAVAALAADGWGETPVPFAVIVMGSAGRGESLLHPDQDNGFILADHPEAERARIDGYFSELARRLTRDLAAVGFPLCPGNVMATNAAWRMTLPQWCARIDDWARARTNIAILNADIFFDFRPVFGATDLASRLRRHVTAAAQGNAPFLNQMAWRQAEEAPPGGLVGRLLAGREGTLGGALDLKLHGTMPFVEAVRLLALFAGVEDTGTLRRLAALRDAGLVDRGDHDELADGFLFLIDLLLRRQVREALAGRTVGTKVAPDELGRRERERLKETLHRVDAFRKRVSARLLGTPVGAGL